MLFVCDRIRHQHARQQQRYAEFAGTRLASRKMGSCLWLVLSVVSRFVGLATTTKEVRATNPVLNATLAINVTKVSLFFSGSN